MSQLYEVTVEIDGIRIGYPSKQRHATMIVEAPAPRRNQQTGEEYLNRALWGHGMAFATRTFIELLQAPMWDDKARTEFECKLRFNKFSPLRIGGRAGMRSAMSSYLSGYVLRWGPSSEDPDRAMWKLCIESSDGAPVGRK